MLFHREYTKDGSVLPNRVMELVHKERALDILRSIHCSTEGGCKVGGSKA